MEVYFPPKHKIGKAVPNERERGNPLKKAFREKKSTTQQISCSISFSIKVRCKHLKCTHSSYQHTKTMLTPCFLFKLDCFHQRQWI